jgi:DNA-binding IclR family transcriptional regulator
LRIAEINVWSCLDFLNTHETHPLGPRSAPVMPKVLSLDKSLSLLEAVFQSRDGIGTRALEQKLDYNVATVHHIAMTFCRRGYLRQDAVSRRFFPGMRLMLLGRHPSYLQSLAASAAAVVDEVAERLNESVLLGSIDQGRIVSLKYVPGRQALRAQEPDDVSDHSHCTAFGKVVLGSLTERELESYLQETRLERFTPSTISTREALRDEPAGVRKQGYARTRDEYCEGISAVAVPIRDPWGAIVASLGASAPTLLMRKAGQMKKSLKGLREAAVRIERIWGEEMGAGTMKKNAKRKKRDS